MVVKNTMCQHLKFHVDESDKGRFIYYKKICDVCGTVFETWLKENI